MRRQPFGVRAIGRVTTRKFPELRKILRLVRCNNARQWLSEDEVILRIELQECNRRALTAQ